MADTTAEPDSRLSTRPTCPRCGARIHRAHRDARDRLVGFVREVRRYRCHAQGCGWVGLLDRPRRGAAPWVIALGALFVAAAASIPLLAWLAPAAWIDAMVGRAPTSADAAPAQAEATVSTIAIPTGATAASDARRPEGEPLGEPRRDCVWQGPGQNAYLGTLAEALRAARLPGEVVDKLVTMRDARLVSDRLEITSAGIRSTTRPRTFADVAKAMALDGTICFDTRIEVPRGTVGGADLYELTTGDDQRHLVMIVRIGGNVAVLEELPAR